MGPDAEAALSLLRSNPPTFHLILTHVVLQGLTGPQLAERAQQLAPASRIPREGES